jgi:hypothetical protein
MQHHLYLQSSSPSTVSLTDHHHSPSTLETGGTSLMWEYLVVVAASLLHQPHHCHLAGQMCQHFLHRIPMISILY